MTVYFIRAGERGPVKIGYAENARIRLRVLQRANPEPLLLIREIPGERKHEAWLHSHFAMLRIRGEWFRFCERMMDIEVPMRALDGPGIWRSPQLRRAIKAAGGVAALAKELGVSRQAVSNWSDVPLALACAMNAAPEQGFRNDAPG